MFSEEHKNDKSPELNRLTNAALGLLARREYSRGELSERLARRSEDQDLIGHVLDALQEQGLQSDQRFCESFVRFRVSQGKGPVRIKQDLRMKKLDAELIDHHLQDISGDDHDFWRLRAAEVYDRKFSDLPVNNDKERAKRLRFLVARGFSAQLAYSLIDRSSY